MELPVDTGCQDLSSLKKCVPSLIDSTAVSSVIGLVKFTIRLDPWVVPPLVGVIADGTVVNMCVRLMKPTAEEGVKYGALCVEVINMPPLTNLKCINTSVGLVKFAVITVPGKRCFSFAEVVRFFSDLTVNFFLGLVLFLFDKNSDDDSSPAENIKVPALEETTVIVPVVGLVKLELTVNCGVIPTFVGPVK